MYLLDSNSSTRLLQIKEIIAIDANRLTAKKFGAKNVLDNNVDTFFSTSNINGIGYGYPWVRIELVNISIVHRVVITNRMDCCGDRLQNLDVRIGISNVLPSETGSKTENILCSNYVGPGRNGEVVTIECTEPIEGKYVILQLMYDPAILNFAEVEVYGTGKKYHNMS